MAIYDQASTATSHRLLRWPEVKHRVGISRSQVHALVLKGQFPAPCKLGARSSAWLQSSIDEWIRSRVSTPAKEL
jgi:prophage regulatory protein